MRRRIRPLSLLLVLMAHVLVAGLVLIGRHLERERPAAEQLVYILPITLQQPVEVAAPTDVPIRPRPRQRRPATSPAPESTAITVEPAPVTPQPPPDWRRELELSARSFGQSQEPATQYRSLDGKPRVLELPKPVDGPADGEVVLLPNGDRQVSHKAGDKTIVCNSTQVPLDEAFSVWAKFRPPKCTIRSSRKDDVPEPKPRPYLGPALPLGQPGDEDRAPATSDR